VSIAIEDLYAIYLQHPCIETDTRKLKPGNLFFALKGPNFNGNEFALKALEMGAAYAVVDETIELEHPRLLKVADTLLALQALAKYHRQQFNIPFIAITGSNGKTTTKELVSSVLQSVYQTYTTEGNLNNHIGVPLTLLRIGKDAEMAVIEMGANHQKEIEGYCAYTLPTHGMITNCGKAHLEGFGGVEGVRKGKGELFDFLRKHQGCAFIYSDYDYLKTMSQGIDQTYFYGTTQGQVTGNVKESDPQLIVNLLSGLTIHTLETQLVGDYNLPNVLAAVAIGKYFKVPDEKIKAAIAHYKPSNSRSQMMMLDSNQIILDAYNANPSSMKAAIENFAHLQAPNKILLLGGMMELGTESLQEHEALLKLVQQYDWKKVVLVGGDFTKISHPFLCFDNSLEAKEWFVQEAFTNSTFLIKGSRSMQMEKIISA